MNDWFASLAKLLRSGRPVVRVTVAAVRGSAPREAGASMLVSTAPAGKAAQGWQGDRLPETGIGTQVGTQIGTIGGGQLEWRANAVAQQMLAQSAPVRVDRYTLGASLGQCCGGAVELWFERYDAGDLAFVEDALAKRSAGPATITTLISPKAPAGAPRRSLQCAVPPATPRYARTRDAVETLRIVERIDPAGMPLYLFGAGHVGNALVRVLGGLPLNITWIDSRPEQLSAHLDGLPDNVTPLLSDLPDDEVAFAPANAYYLVLTHSHDLDDQICRAILHRDDVAWAGLIGSDTKAASFRSRWERRGFSREAIARITCPIGVHGIASKHPAAIAVAVAAQLQQVIEARAAVADVPVRAARSPAVQRQAAALEEASLLSAAIADTPVISAARPH